MAVPVEVPAGARELLDRVDYSDAHRARLETPRTAREAVERAMDAIRPALRPIRVGHRALALHLVPTDADHPMGWSILSESAERLVLGTDGPLFTPRIVVQVGADDVTLATVLRYEQRAAAAIWVGVAPVHRLVLRRLVDASV